MRKLTILFLLVTVLLGTGTPVQAASGVRVEDMSVTHTFGQLLDISAKIVSKTDIQSMKIVILGEDDTFIAADLVDPTLNGTVSFSLDLKERPIRAFSNISIWFELELDDGTSHRTEDFYYFYGDNRFDWQELHNDEFTIFWYQDDPGLGREIMNTAYDGLTRIQNQLDVPTPAGIQIFTYSSLVDMQDALDFSGDSAYWIAGHADTELGVIIISLPPGPDQSLEIRRQVPHELAHVLIYQKLGSGYTYLPRWFNEGLASTAELFSNPDYQLLLDKAYERESLIPLQDLCASFPVDAANFQLSYAESYAFTWYLQQTYGNDKIESLLQAYASGLGCEQGPQDVYNKSLSELEAEWRQAMFNENQVWNIVQESIPLMIVLGFALIAPAGLMVLGVGKRNRDRAAQKAHLLNPSSRPSPASPKISPQEVIQLSESEITRLHATVEGRVQGVGFRAFTQRTAVNYLLTGWVRNRWNGSVEVVAEGPRPDLERLLAVLQRGPFPGTTRQVKAGWQSATREFTSFRVRMTG